MLFIFSQCDKMQLPKTLRYKTMQHKSEKDLPAYQQKMADLKNNLPALYAAVDAKYKASGDALKLAAKAKLLEKLQGDGKVAITLVDIQVGFTLAGAGLTAPGGDEVIVSNMHLLDAVIEIQKEHPELAKNLEIVTSQDAHVLNRDRNSVDVKTMITAYNNDANAVNEIIDHEQLELEPLDGIKSFGLHCLENTPDAAIAQPIEERLAVLEQNGMDVVRFAKINFSGPKAGMLLKQGIRLDKLTPDAGIFNTDTPLSYLSYFNGAKHKAIVMTGICGDVCVEEGALGLAHLNTVEVHDPFVHYLVIKEFGMTYEGKRSGTEAKYKAVNNGKVEYVPYEGFRSNPDLIVAEKKKDDEKKNDDQNALALSGNNQNAPVLTAREQVLANIKFDNYVKVLEAKAANLHKRKKGPAAKVADEIVKDLKAAKDSYLNSKETDSKSVIDFKLACKDAVKKARPELEKHRGFKKFFAEFMSAIFSILTLGIVNAATKRGFFSVVKPYCTTDSAKKLNKMETAVDKEIQTDPALR